MIWLIHFRHEIKGGMIMFIFICDNFVLYSDDGTAAPRVPLPTSPSYLPVRPFHILDESEPLVYNHRFTTIGFGILDVWKITFCYFKIKNSLADSLDECPLGAGRGGETAVISNASMQSAILLWFSLRNL